MDSRRRKGDWVRVNNRFEQLIGSSMSPVLSFFQSGLGHPIFATLSNAIFYYGRNGQIDERETEIIWFVWWRVVEFTRKIPQAEQKDLSISVPTLF